jgi:hypothetical protein
MKVLYCEDVANHMGPESCGGYGNIAAEALTGESVGGTLSSEITASRVLTLCLDGEGNICHSVIASYGRTWRSLSTLACVEASCAGIERSGSNPILMSWNRGVQSIKIPWCVGVRSPHREPGTRNRNVGIGWGEEGEIRTLTSQCLSEVGQQHSTVEAGEQRGTLSPRRSLWREGR